MVVPLTATVLLMKSARKVPLVPRPASAVVVLLSVLLDLNVLLKITEATASALLVTLATPMIGKDALQ